MTRRAVEIAVIGGGIAGLAAADRLARAERDVIVLEQASEVGGVMRTLRQGGFLIEQGPFNVCVRAREFAELLADLRPRIVPIAVAPPAKKNRYVLLGGALERLPTSPTDFVRTRLLSTRAKARVLRGLVWSAPGPSDATIDELTRRRLGSEVADRVASALTIGIWGAESDEVEAASCLPTVAQLDRGRSPLLAVLRARRQETGTPHEGPSGMVSFADGLGALAAALAADLRDRVETGTEVRVIEPSADRFILRTRHARGDEEIEASRLVIATGAHPAGRMLSPVSEQLAGELQAITHVPLTVLNLGFRRDAITHPLDGYGLLVPRPSRGVPVLGVLWASSVFPHHASEGHVLIRVFVGGTRQPTLAAAPEEELRTIVLRALRPILGLRRGPVLTNVARWPHAVPCYRPGHAARVERLRSLAHCVPGLHLIGNFMDGVSINDCIRRAVRTAQGILDETCDDH